MRTQTTSRKSRTPVRARAATSPRPRLVRANLTRHARAPQDSGYTAAELARRTIARRAIEAVSWGMPAVNFMLMLDAVQRDAKAGAGSNRVVYWSKPFDWKNQTLTPNPDTLYFMPFFDTKTAGPMVLEIPAANGGSLVGSIDDAWQTALEDVGPAGVDQGAGGKYLILPPGHDAAVPAGYTPLRAATFQSYALLRSSLKSRSDADVAAAGEYAKRVRVYPLSAAADPPPTSFTDAFGVLFDATIPYDLRFFETLGRFVQYEPWLERDRAMLDVLRTIGIEKGKPFAPDAPTKRILASAIREAHAWMDSVYDRFFAPFAPGARWASPVSADFAEAVQSSYANPDSYPTDGRGRVYSYAYFSAKHLGAGQFYLMTITDKAGKPLEGTREYRLTVPANAPVKQYWSATAYDRRTHALIRDTRWSSRSSLSDGIRQNVDGSTTIYFGPKAPPGREANWVPTSARGAFEVIFRLYGPEKPFFEKQWTLPDIERIG